MAKNDTDNPGLSSGFNLDELTKAKLLLEYKQLLKKTAADEEAERTAKVAREASAKSMEKTRLEKVEAQNECPHLKPSGLPGIGGQKMGNNHYIFICAYCQKEFNELTLPARLRPNADTVGGPQL